MTYQISLLSLVILKMNFLLQNMGWLVMLYGNHNIVSARSKLVKTRDFSRDIIWHVTYKIKSLRRLFHNSRFLVQNSMVQNITKIIPPNKHPTEGRQKEGFNSFYINLALLGYIFIFSTLLLMRDLSHYDK